MAAAWPWTPGAGNPTRLQVDSYSQELIGDGRVVSPMDTGPAKIRTRSLAPALLQGTIILSTDQVATLVTFGTTTLLRWSLPFTFYEPSDETSILVRINPRGRVPSKAFLGPDCWLVTLDLEVLAPISIVSGTGVPVGLLLILMKTPTL